MTFYGSPYVCIKSLTIPSLEQACGGSREEHFPESSAAVWLLNSGNSYTTTKAIHYITLLKEDTTNCFGRLETEVFF